MRLYGPVRPPQTRMPATTPETGQACTLPWCAIRVSGADAESFLNAQLTARVPAQDSAACSLAGYCLPNGRLLAVLWCWRIDGALHLGLPADIADAVMQRLSLYVLRSDVQFERLDVAPHGVVSAPVQGSPGESGLRLALGEASEPLADTATWTRACIAAGVANIHAATQDQVIPQMIGLEELGGLDFRKGCYPGQEIIARLHYKGTLKQRMYRLALDGQTAQAGDPLHCGETTSGLVLSAAESDALVLARVQDAGQRVRIGDSDSDLELPARAVFPDAR